MTRGVKNPALTDAQVWAEPPYQFEPLEPDPNDVPEQERLELGVAPVEPTVIPWTTVGEEGEWAIMRGHVDPTYLARALEDEGSDDIDPDDIEHQWWIFTPHLDGCDGDGCTCDDYGWFARPAAAGTPGALPVTAWSA